MFLDCYFYSGTEATKNENCKISIDVAGTTTSNVSKKKVSEKKVSEKNIVDTSGTTSYGTSISDPLRNSTDPTMRVLLDLVHELKGSKSSGTIPTHSDTMMNTVSRVKEEQKAAAVSPTVPSSTSTSVTKEDFESFKHEILSLSRQNSERIHTSSQSMPGK